MSVVSSIGAVSILSIGAVASLHVCTELIPIIPPQKVKHTSVSSDNIAYHANSMASVDHSAHPDNEQVMSRLSKRWDATYMQCARFSVHIPYV